MKALITALLLAGIGDGGSSDGGTKQVSDGGIAVPWVDGSTTQARVISVGWLGDGGVQVQACGTVTMWLVDGGSETLNLPMCAIYQSSKVSSVEAISNLRAANGI